MNIPPIKIQGIKTKIVPHINDILLKYDRKCKFLEPFCGSGVVSFNVKGFDEYILSDINKHIINFYNNLIKNNITSDSMRKYLESEGSELKVKGLNHYIFIRDKFNKFKYSEDFIFLNRSCFNGMMRFNSKGQFNVPYCKKDNRFSKAYITKIVNQIDKVYKLIKNNNFIFKNEDFYDFIINNANENDIIYIDPPYYGRNVCYYNTWNIFDETKLFELLKSNKYKFILSTWNYNKYRTNENIKKYKDLNFNIKNIDHYYHNGGKIENRNFIVESLIYNF